MSKAMRIAKLVATILVFASPYTGLGQAGGASLAGQVTDPSGAAIPNATVSAENVGTSLTDRSTTDAQGIYGSPPCRRDRTR